MITRMVTGFKKRWAIQAIFMLGGDHSGFLTRSLCELPSPKGEGKRKGAFFCGGPLQLLVNRSEMIDQHKRCDTPKRNPFEEIPVLAEHCRHHCFQFQVCRSEVAHCQECRGDIDR